MHKFEDIGVVIPVRLGSSRLKEKVLLPFGNEGDNLLSWKIKQLLPIIPASNIFVSTNSDLLFESVKHLGVSFHRRSDYLSNGHDATFSEVITGIVCEIPKKHIAWVTVVVPLMSTAEYEEGFDQYLQTWGKSNDSLMSVNLVKEYFWDDKGPLNYSATRNHTISQELPDFYRVTNGLYMRDKESILREGYFLGPNPFKFKVTKVSGVDIDEKEDYEIAVSLFSK